MLLKDKNIQKTNCPIRLLVSTVDKDNPIYSIQKFLYSKYTKHNHRSVAPIGLLFYRRQQRGKRFYNFLLTCRSSRASLVVTRAIAKAEFITKLGLSTIAATLILRDIYNKFAKLRYEIISTKTLADRILQELANEEFFTALETDSKDRLYCLFFVYPKCIEIYKQNAYALIFDYTYQIYASGLLILYFDFITGLGKCLLLAYILIPDETFDGYEQAFI